MGALFVNKHARHNSIDSTTYKYYSSTHMYLKSLARTLQTVIQHVPRSSCRVRLSCMQIYSLHVIHVYSSLHCYALKLVEFDSEMSTN